MLPRSAGGDAVYGSALWPLLSVVHARPTDAHAAAAVPAAPETTEGDETAAAAAGGGRTDRCAPNILSLYLELFFSSRLPAAPILLPDGKERELLHGSNRVADVLPRCPRERELNGESRRHSRLRHLALSFPSLIGSHAGPPLHWLPFGASIHHARMQVVKSACYQHVYRIEPSPYGSMCAMPMPASMHTYVREAASLLKACGLVGLPAQGLFLEGKKREFGWRR